MKLVKLILHNFRSIKHMDINTTDYSLLVGENNVGKTAILTALRLFYEDDGIKYTQDIDFPKFDTDDQESWIELHFMTTSDEQVNLKEEYRSSDSVLRVRKYFLSNVKELVKAGQSNIYGYENGSLSKTLFYGAKNISQAKLGKVVYIPEVNRADDSLKVSGPSPFRNMLNFVMKRAVQKSDTYAELEKSFEKFNSDFREEASKDGFSVSNLEKKINEALGSWQIKFGVDINPLRPEDIVKNLLGHYIEDINLNSQRVKIGSFGQGLQRHLIYTLIRLSASLKDSKKSVKKEFLPDFTLILFEEPEAFLHPSQQSILDIGLRSLSNEEGHQVIISTHSPQFVSRNIEDITSICRLNKYGPVSKCFQVSEEKYNRILDTNLGLYRCFCEKLKDPAVSDSLKSKIRKKCLGDDDPNEDKKLEEETIRYFLWLDSERAALFFAKHVVICEGATEKIALDYLTDINWNDIRSKHVYFLDSGGKFNIHRYITILDCLGISHSVLIDKDDDRDYHSEVNDFIKNNLSPCTILLETFDKDFESFLGITSSVRPDKKPLHLLSKLKAGQISNDRINELRKVLERLLPQDTSYDSLSIHNEVPQKMKGL